MKTKVHAIAGIVGLLMISVFWISTAVTELMGSPAAIVSVKTSILWGMAILIPAMAIVGGSGISLGRGRGDGGVLRKKRRMPIIAANGLLVLVPSAVFLAMKASAREFDGAFYAIQALELIAGATNLVLMGLSVRDGLRLTGRLAGVHRDAAGATIKLRENGPAIVTGLKDLVGANGEILPTKPTVALCRCGASKNKPFCDGSHVVAGFSDAD